MPCRDPDVKRAANRRYYLRKQKRLRAARVARYLENADDENRARVARRRKGGQERLTVALCLGEMMVAGVAAGADGGSSAVRESASAS